MSAAATERSALRIEIGAGGAAALAVDLPVLGGDRVERLFDRAVPAGAAGEFSLFEAPGWLVGAARVPAVAGLEAGARRLYQELLELAGPRTLARIWNYVPAINAPGPDGLENYRAFCRGRSLAFEHGLGANFKQRVPAASAVGSEGDDLVVIFAATEHPVRHVENPLQVPACDYPQHYGPRAPSFARATVVAGPGGPVFISGTSAIRGHATVAPHRTAAQLECTLANLREVSLASGLGAAGARRSFKAYLRHAGDFPAVAATLAEKLLRPGDTVTYLRSDICRADLNIEIEAVVHPA